MHDLLARASRLAFSFFSARGRLSARTHQVPAHSVRTTSATTHTAVARSQSAATHARDGLQRPTRSAAPPIAKTKRNAARPVRVLRAREGTIERLAIVGRMADVCAELDRLVARERLC